MSASNDGENYGRSQRISVYDCKCFQCLPDGTLKWLVGLLLFAGLYGLQRFVIVVNQSSAYYAVSETVAARGVVTALKPIRAEQVERPEQKQNRTVPPCGSVLPIYLSLRPVGPIHIIIIKTVSIIICIGPTGKA